MNNPNLTVTTQTEQDAALPFPTLDGDTLQTYNQLVSTLYRCLHDNAGFQPFFDAFQQHFKALHNS